MSTAPKHSIDIPAIVLCGGKSSRMADRTQDKLPKHLLDVRGKRIIDYVVEPFVSSPQLILATGVHGAQVAEHVKAAHAGAAIGVSHRDTPEGVIPAIHGALSDFAIDGQFLLTSGDEVIVGLSAPELLLSHRLSQKAASLVVSSQMRTTRDFGFTHDEHFTAQSLARSHEPAIEAATHYGTGTFVLHTELLPDMTEAPTWEHFVRTLINKQVLHCHVTDQPFFNLNTPDELALFEQTFTPASS